MPFVQGQLSAQRLSSVIETECGHCHRSMRIEVDSDLNYRVKVGFLDPLIYVPLVNLGKLDAPSIIDGF